MTEAGTGDPAVSNGDGDLPGYDTASLQAMLGAPSKKGALRRGFKSLPRILPYLRPYRKFAVLSVLITILLAVLALAEPWPLAFVVDSIIGDKPAPGWVTAIFGSGVGPLIALAVAATLFLTLLAGGLTVLNEYLSTTVDQRMVLDLRSDMFEHAQKLSLAFHDKESKGILMYRINDQAAAMGQIVVALPVLAQNLLTVVGMAYISIRINPLLALLALGTTPFIVYSTTYYTDRIEPRLYRVRGLGAINLAIVYEAMAMMRVVLAFGTQRREFTRFRTQGETFVDETVGLTVRQTAFKLAVQLITSAGTAAVIGVGAYQAVKGQITAGELLVVLVLHRHDLSAARGADRHDHELPAVVHQPPDVVRSHGHGARGRPRSGTRGPWRGRAGRSSSTESGSATRDGPTSSRTSRSGFRPGRRSRSSVRPGLASRRS